MEDIEGYAQNRKEINNYIEQEMYPCFQSESNNLQPSKPASFHGHQLYCKNSHFILGYNNECVIYYVSWLIGRQRLY